MTKASKSAIFKVMRVLKILSSLKPIVSPLFGFLLSCLLLLSVKAYADTANFYTGCIKNSGSHNLYNATLGTTPSSPCNSGDTQVSADYGDITSVVAGTGLTGGATQGDATISIANGGVGTTQLADTSVTAAKVNSGTASTGQVLTADGSGGASWQGSSGGSSTAAYYASFDWIRDNNSQAITADPSSPAISLQQLPAGHYVVNTYMGASDNNVTCSFNSASDFTSYPSAQEPLFFTYPNGVGSFTEVITLSQPGNINLYCGYLNQPNTSFLIYRYTMSAIKIDTINGNP